MGEERHGPGANVKPYGTRVKANEITEIGKAPVAAPVVVKARARRAAAEEVRSELEQMHTPEDQCDGCEECAPELFGVEYVEHAAQLSRRLFVPAPEEPPELDGFDPDYGL